MKRLFRNFISSQQRLSRFFDSFLPDCFRKDGNKDFLQHVVPGHLKPHLKVYDVGGGKQPCLSLQEKESFTLRIVGLDICERELAKAPKRIYDDIIVADITSYVGASDGDLIICQSLLEHVWNIEKAIASLNSLCVQGGHVLLFVPSRNAVYARINRCLPESIKRKILYTVYPSTRNSQGFPAYYDRCTVAEVTSLARKHGFQVEKVKTYYLSSYFSFFFPLYVVWRIWILLYYVIDREASAETFSVILRKTNEISV